MQTGFIACLYIVMKKTVISEVSAKDPQLLIPMRRTSVATLGLLIGGCSSVVLFNLSTFSRDI